MYKTENELVEAFLTELREAEEWGVSAFAREFYYVRGRTDVVGVLPCGAVFAVEAKLAKWREALQQAYRNRCFAHQSYVLLPPKEAELARSFELEFQRRQVGLCTVIDGEVRVLLDPPRQEPLQPWLAQEAVRRATAAVT